MIIKDSEIHFGQGLRWDIAEWFYSMGDGIEKLSDFLLFLERTSKLN